MATTDTDIANLALLHLGESALESFTEQTVKGVKVRRAYDICRDSLLRSHPWNFAMTRVTLAANATAPDFGPEYAYDLPSDCLRVFSLNGAEADQSHAHYSIEGNQLLTDADEANITYIKQVTNPSLFDAQFVEAFALKLAADLALDITQSEEKLGLMLARYNEAMPEAQMSNAQGDDPKVISPLSTSRAVSVRRNNAGFDDDW